MENTQIGATSKMSHQISSVQGSSSRNPQHSATTWRASCLVIPNENTETAQAAHERQSCERRDQKSRLKGRLSFKCGMTSAGIANARSIKLTLQRIKSEWLHFARWMIWQGSAQRKCIRKFSAVSDEKALLTANWLHFLVFSSSHRQRRRRSFEEIAQLFEGTSANRQGKARHESASNRQKISARQHRYDLARYRYINNRQTWLQNRSCLIADKIFRKFSPWSSSVTFWEAISLSAAS